MNGSRVALLLLAGAATLAAAVRAHANGTALPDTLSVALRPDDATSLALEANFGFLEAPDGTNFRWICHETLLPATSSITPTYFEGGGDSLLVTVRSLGIANDPDHSLYFSADGCDWDAAGGLTDVLVREVAFDPSNLQHLLAASSTGAGADNGIWVSTDGGRNWTATSLMMPDRFFRTVRFAPSDPQIVWASSTWYMPAAAYLYRSTNGGVSWSERSIDFSPGGTLQSQLDVLAVSPTDPDTAYLRTEATTNYLLLTTNGGESWEQVFSLADGIRSVAWHPDGSVWLAAGESGSFRAPDGRNFEEIGTGPLARGFATDSRGMFAVSNNFADGWALGRATTGTAFTGLFQFHQLAGTRSCPVDSETWTVCEPLWPALQQKLGITTPVPSPSPSPSGNPGGGGGGGCQCDVAAGRTTTLFGVALLTTLLAIGMTIRRRRRDGE